VPVPSLPKNARIFEGQTAHSGPTFRTRRPLAGFWLIEPEIAFADISDNTALAEGLPNYTFAALLNERQQDLAFFDERIEKGLVAMVPRA
jgi:asparaginyl-tRNA synthetase